jgi:hypothetical protein
VKRGADDKRGKAPLFSLAKLLVEVLLRPNAVREKPSAGRRKVRKALLRLAPDNANLVLR